VVHVLTMVVLVVGNTATARALSHRVQRRLKMKLAIARLVLVCAASAAAQKLDVKIIDRQVARWQSKLASLVQL
jgi:uncharacterized membrane protein YoaK (UPF0700 family)